MPRHGWRAASAAIPQGAPESRAGRGGGPGDRRIGGARALALACLIVLWGFLPLGAPARAGTAPGRPLQLEVFLNGETTKLVGAFFQDEGGRIAAQRKELEEVGIRPPGRGDPEAYVTLDGMEGLSFTYDEPRQRIDVTASDARRMPHTVDARGATEPPRDASAGWGAVVNYTIFAASVTEWSRKNLDFSGASAQVEGRLFTPYGTLSQTAIAGATMLTEADLLRLDTTYLYTDVESAVSYRAGDVITRGPVWSRPIRLGGFQAERNYGVRADIVTAPLPSVSGSAALPSTVDVYVNNVRSFSREVPAGPYRITNLPAISGGGTARVVLRDVSGREVETSLPFFASSSLLREGLYDFALQGGWPRLAYAAKPFSYGEQPVGLASLRYGWSDHLTLDAHVEGGAGLVNGGAGLVTNAGALGVLALAGRASAREGRTGFQGFASFETSILGIALSLSTQRTFKDFEDLASVTAVLGLADLDPARYGAARARDPTEYDPLTTGSILKSARPPRALDRVSVGVPLPFARASVGASFVSVEREGGERSRLVTASYSQSIFASASLSASAFADVDRRDRGFSFSFSTPLGVTEARASAGIASNRNGAFVTAEAVKPLGAEAGSYGLRVRTAEGRAASFRQAQAAYRSPVGRAEATVEQVDGGARGTLELEGSVVSMGSSVLFGPRVDDAFAVVDTGMAGVGVLFENRPIGRTNLLGQILVPGLVAHQRNRIALDPATLPTGAYAARTDETVTPAERSGVRVDFGVEDGKTSAVVIFHDGAGQPIRAGVRGRIEGQPDAFMVGFDGRAYLRSLKPSNKVTISTPGGSCAAEFAYQGEADTQAVIGPVPCL